MLLVASAPVMSLSHGAKKAKESPENVVNMTGAAVQACFIASRSRIARGGACRGRNFCESPFEMSGKLSLGGGTQVVIG